MRYRRVGEDKASEAGGSRRQQAVKCLLVRNILLPTHGRCEPFGFSALLALIVMCVATVHGRQPEQPWLELKGDQFTVWYRAGYGEDAEFVRSWLLRVEARMSSAPTFAEALAAEIRPLGIPELFSEFVGWLADGKVP